jgi:hypothetical protein
MLGHAVPFQPRRPQAPMPNPRYITNIAGGWLVTLPIAGKRAVTKTFRGNDEERAALLMAAVSWHDRAHRRLLGGPVPERSFHSQARDSSTTGVPGVRFVVKVVRNRGSAGVMQYEVPCVVAEVHTIKGKDYERPKGSRSRVWSLNKYEWDEAVALATSWRWMMIGELAGVAE